MLRITKAAVCWCYLKNKMKPSTKRNSPSHTHFDEQIAHFHFHPLVNNIVIKKTSVFFKSLNIEISFKGKNISLKKELYKYACGFNKTENAVKLTVVFESDLETIIKL